MKKIQDRRLQNTVNPILSRHPIMKSDARSRNGVLSDGVVYFADMFPPKKEQTEFSRKRRLAITNNTVNRRQSSATANSVYVRL